ncbi:oxidoreductase [Shewanella algicola]|uniref:SDR family oxidoreductase n=1 Tax=Shewanella algicola TaxID=640633 RepID=A0A9X1Z2S6_9GAMM|nr:SDR family oxidoreductase [Shewanella algicola]MCL1103938.1 SDR family oxidoreductase [Shewanella algicola]GGP38903.1 oxidoreductase [Shewanella algicola]
MNLTNKLYVVTGAAADSDIGLAICKKLDECGAKLILVGRREAALIETKRQLTQQHHQIAAFDLSHLEDIQSWVKSLINQFGAIDGLVHSASYQGYSPLRTISPKQISQYLDVNFSAAVLLIAAFSKAKHFNSGASFVFIGSAAGQRGLKARTLYAASKAALSSMVQSAALELANKKIRVNCVAPAVVSGAKAELQFSALGEQQSQILVDAHPLGLSSPQDVANSVYFLLSGLSANTTGITLAVDGGFLAG